MNYTTIQTTQNTIDAIAHDLVRNIADKLFNALADEGLSKGEELCQELGNKLSRKLLSVSLNTVDRELEKNISRIDYKKVSRESRTIHSVFGQVSFSRYRYAALRPDASKTYYYPLDEKIGLVSSARISPLLTQVAAGIAIDQSYESASKSIERFTGCEISRMAIRECVIRTAEIIDDENKKKTQAFWDDCEVIGKVDAPTLYVESDAVYIAQQQRGNKRGSKKLKVNMLKAYNGKTTVKNSTQVDNPVVFGKAENIKSFQKEGVAMIYSKFAYPGVQKCYHSTDGEAGYKNMTSTIHPQAQHILDPYHIHSKITDKCSDKEFGHLIRRLIFESNNVYGACRKIDELRKSANTLPKDSKKLSELYDYLHNNAKSINTEFPKLGTMESTNGHVVGARMKVFGGGWGVLGANAMLTIRASLASGEELPLMKRTV